MVDSVFSVFLNSSSDEIHPQVSQLVFAYFPEWLYIFSNMVPTEEHQDTESSESAHKIFIKFYSYKTTSRHDTFLGETYEAISETIPAMNLCLIAAEGYVL